MDIRDAVGRRVLHYRHLRDMTQNKLGEVAGIDRGYVSDIENGKRKITIDIIDKIARALNIPASALLEAELHENPPEYNSL
ncbi:helix-turn-helix transcriptional regulator [bacterium]|nr:helix-turn-helix transcriptional regulator [bacterium]